MEQIYDWNNYITKMERRVLDIEEQHLLLQLRVRKVELNLEKKIR